MGCYGAIRDDLTLAALTTVHRIDHTLAAAPTCIGLTMSTNNPM